MLTLYKKSLPHGMSPWKARRGAVEGTSIFHKTRCNESDLRERDGMTEKELESERDTG